MKRFLTITFLTLSLTLVSVAQGKKAKAPVVTLKDLHGKTVRLSDFRGKIVLLNFWATWCVPCAAEVPALVNWQKEYKGKLQIIGLTYPPVNISKIRTYVRRARIKYPILLGTRATKELFKLGDTLPVTVIIDRKGRIVDRIDGVIFADEFETKVKPLLK